MLNGFLRSKRPVWLLSIIAFLVSLVILRIAGGDGVPVTGKAPFRQLQAPLPSIAAPTAAEKPAYTPVEGRLDPQCLVGEWEITNLTRTMTDAWMSADSPLRVVGVDGATRYRFMPDGRLEITFDDLSVKMTGVIEGEEIQAANHLKGSATALYEVDVFLQEIRLSAFGGDGIQFEVEMNDQVLTSGDFPAWRAFTSAVSGGEQDGAGQPAARTRVVEQANAAAHCTADTLAIQALDPLPGPRVELTRID